MAFKEPQRLEADVHHPSQPLTTSSSNMYQYYKANDGLKLAYQEKLPQSLRPNGHIPFHDEGPYSEKVIILIHGWAGSSAVFVKNMDALATKHRVIGVDLRGHGQSFNASSSGTHLPRLAMDLKNLIDHLKLPEGKLVGVGASLGCAVLWSYIELFTASAFSDLIFVDQSPLQNYTTVKNRGVNGTDGPWGHSQGSIGCNSAETLAILQTRLEECPQKVYEGLLESCLAYRSHPTESDNVSPERRSHDDHYFTTIARQCDARWLGRLMAEHTLLDWRQVIELQLGRACMTRILVVASDRSGCFHPQGPRWIDDALTRSRHRYPEGMGRVKGVTIDWGGHWCYWEDGRKFNDLVLGWLEEDQDDVEHRARESPI